MSLRCTACPAAVEYGVEFCHTCREAINDYNRDLVDREDDSLDADGPFVDDNGDEILS